MHQDNYRLSSVTPFVMHQDNYGLSSVTPFVMHQDNYGLSSVTPFVMHQDNYGLSSVTPFFERAPPSMYQDNYRLGPNKHGLVTYIQVNVNIGNTVSWLNMGWAFKTDVCWFWLVGWFCCFTSQVNSYGHCGTVSSPNHTFSWAGLNQQLTSNLCTYFRL